jgi:hypothetical protein
MIRRLLLAVTISVFIVCTSTAFGSSMGKAVDISSKLPANKELMDIKLNPSPADDLMNAGEILIVNTYPVRVNKAHPINVAVKRLDNGSFFSVWEEWLKDDKFTGIATQYSDSMQETGKSVYYTDPKNDAFTKNNSVTPFSDGNVMVAYEDKKDFRARFVIFSPEMKIIKGPVLIRGSAAEHMSIARLAGGKTAMIAFHEPAGITGTGKFIIVNSSGDILGSPSVFSKERLISGISAAPLLNGLVFIAYQSGFGRSVVIDQYGNVISPMSVYYSKQASKVTAIPLDNGNVMVTFRDEQDKPRFAIIDPQGKSAGSPGYLFNEAVDDVVPVKLNNGNVMAAVTPVMNGYPAALSLTIIGQTGKSVKRPKVIINDLLIAAGNYQIAAVKKDMALILFGGFEDVKGGQDIHKYGFLLVK